MNTTQLLRTLICGALIAAASPPARAEGTFDIPAGAHFNKDKLAKISEFFHEAFGVQDVVSKTPISDKTIFRLS